MNKGNGVYIWVLCVLLFVAGVVFGSAAQLRGGVLSALDGTIGNLGDIATVVAAIFAFYAWRSWRQQFLLTETFKASAEMCAAIADIRYLQDYIKQLAKWYGTRYEGMGPDERELVWREMHASKQAWHDCQYRYTSVYYSVCALNGEEDLKEILITPAYLDSANDVVSYMCGSDSPRYAKEETLRDLHEKLIQAKRDSYWAADEFRKKVAGLIRDQY